MGLLTRNSDLARDGIWGWSIPALAAKLPDGTVFHTCPNAGACASLCYARNGTYNFPAVKAAHVRNLIHVLEQPQGWSYAMIKEIKSKRRIPYLRIHDAGDFYSSDYLDLWIEIAESCPDTLMYCYTKEVALFKRYEAESRFPTNFRYLFSMGGRQDHLIDVDSDRHAEVFSSLDALQGAGYMDQAGSDILAITLPTNKIGIVANNIPQFKKRMGGRAFGTIQIEMRSRKTPDGRCESTAECNTGLFA
jgi:hypothetical protein